MPPTPAPGPGPWTPRLTLFARNEKAVMSEKQKKTRALFRDAVFVRARYRCQGPGCRVVASAGSAEALLDAHHITPRELMPNGGYVHENGIALCKANCHEKAEICLRGGDWPGFDSLNLYALIKSSRPKAEEASRRLKMS